MSYSVGRLDKLVEKNRVHRDVYTNPEVFDLEMERLWGRAWVYVGHESQVSQAGEFITTSIGTEPVVLSRDKFGQVHVLYNRCGHKGAKVAAHKTGKTSMFRCPYHGWSYHLDGKLNVVPHDRGYDDTGFDREDPQFSMQPVARVASHRGFVFASLAGDGPDLKTFLGATIATIDNMCDRSPVGKVEVVGSSLPYMHDCNWKMFIENLNDAVHPMVAHASVGHATRKVVDGLPEGAPTPGEAEIISPFGGSYEFFDSLGCRTMPFGHSFMGGKGSIHSSYSEIPGYMESMVASYGQKKVDEILSQNRHNTTVYPSFTLKDAVQVARVCRPIAVDKTLIESWHFRLVGAPEEMLHRTITYSRLINSPASMVGPDDWDCYERMQNSLQSESAHWVDMRRFIGQEKLEGDVTVSPGTSDQASRNQYKAWSAYMTGEVA
ncbi:MAG: Rieske 2Fe-2S domain-containing protein [Gammaproteobacteria bacterium]|jgi:nitrite reductase/ring-hydroxylating ferredoxin subunit|nr:Rieske 2Fe-2S domain-containing protein [Gammaproteobacteria bacterium]MBT5156079.1 Rieske 2Fe-2S domain-containing protein [Gammaproteobacteria bacterium]MBT5685296.1 Rieske 2Fe-2S domain-containing protein [Gammaproteobacteria bacterium]MBT5724064.1 Rieske 2Fe-2S domain-containing protein [Gammaproteobacteria bacterium]MBT6891072.1 Rieske 2Fe-2S domain-containing protein [Gammaproteobacteria bacterium]